MYVGIIPPAADLPPAKAAWSGIWSGWACRNKTCDIKLAVREVRADGATIIYSFASPWIGPFMTQVEAEFVGEEVQAYIGKGISVAYRMRTNGYVECLLTQGENWVAGVLSRDK